MCCATTLVVLAALVGHKLQAKLMDGCTLLLQVETKSKTQDAAETVTVRLNYKDWLEEFKQRGTCTYRGAAR